MHQFALRLTFVITLLGAAVLVGRTAPGQTAWYEGFEGPETSWRQGGGNARFRVEWHARVRGQAHTGDTCERLSVRGDGGTHVHFSHPIGRPRVISELSPSVWIKSDRPGLQILAQVVLPRTVDPQTGRPVSTLLRGSSYTDVGRWQQLRIDDVPQLLTRQVYILRSQMGPNVDGREAYVESILLNVYGGPGVTNVWIDDLDVAGYVTMPSGTGELAGTDHDPVSPVRSAPWPAVDGAAGTFSHRSNGSRSRRVKMDGSVLLVDGRPMLPRAIQYQGEPLAVLKRLGFNTVWLKRPPSTELLEEAAHLDLWLICPPPWPPQEPLPNESQAPLTAIGPKYDRVLAWDLGSGLSGEQLETTRRWAQQVRSADSRNRRPLICKPESDLRAYSRLVDQLILVIGRSPLFSSLELADYGTWLRRRPRLARPGTPIWTTVDTQPDDSLIAQWSVLGRVGSPPMVVSSEQIRLLLYTTITAGGRGLLFESRWPLDATDLATRSRAMTLELLNLELDLIEPWMAAGSFVATVEGNEPEVKGVVLRTDRARLLLGIWSAPGAQYVPGQSAGNGVSFVVPGVPESYSAYLVTAGGLEPIRHKRVAGGTAVTLEEFGLTSLVVLTQDPLVQNSLARRAAQIGRRAAELQRQLANAKLQAVGQVYGQLRQAASDLPARDAAAGSQSDNRLRVARENLQWCDGYWASRDYVAACLHAERAMRPLRLLQREHWSAAARRLGSPVASPAAVSFWTLPRHWDFINRIAHAQFGPNQLAGGDFENLDTWLRSGWNHFRHPTAGINTEANLAPGAARSGGLGLRLSARPAGNDKPPIQVETPPLWIITPAVPVEAGAVVAIRGWVQIPKPIAGSIDGLLIIDSLSGEPLAERIRRTDGWREFVLYRVAPHSGQLTVTFALSGLGEAWLDDLTIRQVVSHGPLASQPR